MMLTPDQRDYFKYVALGDIENVEKLLTKGIDPNTQDIDGEIFKELFPHKNSQKKCTALHISLHNWCPRKTQLINLLVKHVFLDLKNQYGHPPLFYAYGSYISQLISYGAAPLQTNLLFKKIGSHVDSSFSSIYAICLQERDAYLRDKISKLFKVSRIVEIISEYVMDFPKVVQDALNYKGNGKGKKEISFFEKAVINKNTKWVHLLLQAGANPYVSVDSRASIYTLVTNEKMGSNKMRKLFNEMGEKPDKKALKMIPSNIQQPLRFDNINLVDEFNFPEHSLMEMDSGEMSIISCNVSDNIFLFTKSLFTCIGMLTYFRKDTGQVILGLAHSQIDHLDNLKMLIKNVQQHPEYNKEKIKLYFAGGMGKDHCLSNYSRLLKLAKKINNVEVIDTLFNPFACTQEMWDSFEEKLTWGSGLSLSIGIKADGMVVASKTVDVSLGYNFSKLGEFLKLEKGKAPRIQNFQRGISHKAEAQSHIRFVNLNESEKNASYVLRNV